jgi:hypothetical protein
MSSDTFSGQMFRLCIGLLVTASAYWLWHGSGLHQITAGEAEGLNTLILLIGSIYAVIFAFVIFVIWGQFTDVENFMMRECNSLNELLRFSAFVNPDARRAIRHAVAAYVLQVVRSEWPALGERRRDKSTEKAFSELLDAILRAEPVNAEERVMHQRLIDIGKEAGEHRDERLTKSLTKIPATLIHLVHTLAAALALLMFFYPFHNWVAGMCCFLLVAVVLFLANLVMTDTDNPFKGVYNVSSEPFSELRV